MKIQDVLKLPEGTKVIGINDNVFTVADNGVGYKCLKSEIGTLIEYVYPFHLIVDYDYRVLRENLSFKELLEMQESTEGIIAISLDNIDNLPECYKNGESYSIGKALNILSNCFTSKDLSHLLLHNKSFLLK